MRFIFHAMLGFSIGIVGTGMAYGTVARDHGGHDGARLRLSRGHAAAAQIRVPVEATVAPPLPMLPRYGVAVTPGATLVWHLLEGTDGAQVELSSTPTFEPGTTKLLDVDGETLKLPTDLGTGILYWRLRGRAGDVTGERTSSTWMVDVVAASEPVWG
jgi:hypothetical protein